MLHRRHGPEQEEQTRGTHEVEEEMPTPLTQPELSGPVFVDISSNPSQDRPQSKERLQPQGEGTPEPSPTETVEGCQTPGHESQGQKRNLPPSQ